MTLEQELAVLEARIEERSTGIWNRLEDDAEELWRDLECLRITTIAVLVVAGRTPGDEVKLHGIASAADARMPPEQIDRLLREAAKSTDRDTRRVLRPQ